MDLNKTLVIGRLTQDMALEYTTNGAAIGKFSIAVDHMKKKDGTSDTSFFNCKVFGKMAESLNPYLKRGKQISICGYFKQDRWEKDGQKQSRLILNCEEIQLLGGNSQNTGNSNGGYGYGD